MRTILFFLGVSLSVAGVAVIYWPAALVGAGLFMAFVAIRMDEPTQQAKGKPPRIVSKADHNIN